jgi:hypothetical protein
LKTSILSGSKREIKEEIVKTDRSHVVVCSKHAKKAFPADGATAGTIAATLPYTLVPFQELGLEDMPFATHNSVLSDTRNTTRQFYFVNLCVN